MSKVKESFADYLNFRLGAFNERQIASPGNPSLPQSATEPATSASYEVYIGRTAAFDKLLAFARSARNAFAERLACLTDERIDSVFEEGDDANADLDDQIGNYEVLLAKADAVIAEAEGR